jgi:poly(U)-specific endoribonuclease
MEHLKTDLLHMIEFCSTAPPDVPSEALQRKVKPMHVTLEQDVVTLPARIKAIISHNFAQMGWDPVRKIVTNRDHFNIASLTHALRSILDEVENWAPPTAPTAEELGDLSLACSKLWDLDVHRLFPSRVVPGSNGSERDYVLNVQNGKYVYDRGDAASERLFTFVNERVFERPTFKAFIALLDNYIAQTGQSEVVTDEERAENRQFLDMIMDTAVMQYVHAYLVARGKTRASTREQFVAELNELWFGLYSRKARNDSSGFEHVFLGEVRDDTGEVTGFHNWIRIYLEEQKGNFDYQGYIKPKRRGHGGMVPSSCEQFISLQFTWNGALKPVSSSFVGTSPEFEMALYTLCYYMGDVETVVRTGPYKVMVTCHRWPEHPHEGQKQYIATAFPSEAPLDENEAASRIQVQAKSRNAQKWFSN